jgi:hypothetical protein
MVLIDKETNESFLRAAIKAWLPRIVHNGVFAFLHYEEEGWEHVKPLVDKMMKDHEQIAMAGTMVAYRIIDPVTEISWNMMQDAYERHGVLQ